MKWEQGRHIMQAKTLHWLEYDPVALAVLVIGLALIELLALSI
jgi:phage terminase large subunit-like protein